MRCRSTPWTGTTRAGARRSRSSTPTTGKVLDTQAIGHFQSGAYLSWNLSGNVVIKVTDLSGRQRGHQRPLLRRQADRSPRAPRHVPGHGHDDAGQLARDLRGRWLRHRRRHQRHQPQAPLLRHPGRSPGPRPIPGPPARPTLRALQNAANTGRIESAWYSSSS